MGKSNLSILFLGKKGDRHCQKALDFCLQNFHQVDAYMAEWGEKRPDIFNVWEGDLIISYLSRWIIPESLISRAQLAAINFHPAPPNYPGIGCINFALYDETSSYGATCHHMKPAVDTGGIITVNRISIQSSDTVDSLLQRTYDTMFTVFNEVLENVLKGTPLPKSNEQWAGKARTRIELNNLSKITPQMSNNEVAKRVRATTFGPWKPVVEIGGYIFELQDPDK